MFDWEKAIALQAMQGDRPHLVARGKSHGFFLVVAGNWGTFSSYEGDAPSKLVFVYCSQDTCLGMTDIAGS